MRWLFGIIGSLLVLVATVAAASAADLQRRSSPPASPSTATTRDFGEIIFQDTGNVFVSAASVRRAFGMTTINALAAAGIRYRPDSHAFQDARDTYVPLFAIDRGGTIDVIVEMNGLNERGEADDCQSCPRRLGLVRAEAGARGRVTNIGSFDNPAYGIVGRVHLLSQSGPTFLFGVHVARVEGDRYDLASLLVIGERGLVAGDVPLLPVSGMEVSDSAPLLRRRVRLEGDRLVVLYPGARPGQAVFRIGSDRLQLIEGGIPAALRQTH